MPDMTPTSLAVPCSASHRQNY